MCFKSLKTNIRISAAFSRCNALCAILIFSALPCHLTPMSAQGIPNFQYGGQQSQFINGSPAIAASPSANIALMLVAYQDGRTKHLFVAQSSDGSVFSSPLDSGVVMASTSLAMVNYGDFFYIVYATPTGFSMIRSFQGTSFTSPQSLNINTPNGYNTNFRPGLAVYNNKLYLSLAVPGGSSYYTGLVSSTDGINFSNYVVPVYLTTNSGSALAVYQPAGGYPKLCIVFTQGPSNVPVLGESSDGIKFTAAADNSFQIGGDPALVPFKAAGNSSPALYILGRSNFSGNNLFIAGTYDGVNFSQAYKYSQILHFSPAAALGFNNQIRVNSNLVTAFESGSSTSLISIVALN